MKRKNMNNENNILYLVFECKEDFDYTQSLLYIYKTKEEVINSLVYNNKKDLFLAKFNLNKQSYTPIYANSNFALSFCDKNTILI